MFRTFFALGRVTNRYNNQREITDILVAKYIFGLSVEIQTKSNSSMFLNGSEITSWQYIFLGKKEQTSQQVIWNFNIS